MGGTIELTRAQFDTIIRVVGKTRNVEKVRFDPPVRYSSIRVRFTIGGYGFVSFYVDKEGNPFWHDQEQKDEFREHAGDAAFAATLS